MMVINDINKTPINILEKWSEIWQLLGHYRKMKRLSTYSDIVAHNLNVNYKVGDTSSE